MVQTMTTYDGVSKESWNEELEATRLDNRKLLYALWSLFGTPETMLDVGCGNGDLVWRSRQIGIQAYGVDQLVYYADDSIYDPGWFSHHDLRQPYSLRKISGAPSTVDMVLCWEIAEHIPQESHEVLCDTCANHLHRGNRSYLIWTSAHPGQGGTEHISSRPATYWRDMFYKRGLNYMPHITAQISLAWLNIQNGMYWMPANVQVFERG